MIEKPSYQLTFELELEEGDDPSTGSGLGVDAAIALEAARRAIEARQEKPAWFEEFESLMRGGWPFRVAMYIAWAASPRTERWPKDLPGLADVMGLKSPRAIHTWREKNKAIDAQVAAMQAAPLFQHRADVVQALVDSASTANYKNQPDRRLFFQLTGELSEDVNLKVSGKGLDISGYTDEQLAEMAGIHEGNNQKSEDQGEEG